MLLASYVLPFGAEEVVSSVIRFVSAARPAPRRRVGRRNAQVKGSMRNYSTGGHLAPGSGTRDWLDRPLFHVEQRWTDGRIGQPHRGFRPRDEDLRAAGQQALQDPALVVPVEF